MKKKKKKKKEEGGEREEKRGDANLMIINIKRRKGEEK